MAIDAAISGRKSSVVFGGRRGWIDRGRLDYPGTGRFDPAQHRRAWSFGGTEPALAWIRPRALGLDRLALRSRARRAGHATEPRSDFERAGIGRFRRIVERALPQGAGGIADRLDHRAIGRSGIVRPQSQQSEPARPWVARRSPDRFLNRAGIERLFSAANHRLLR